MKLDFVGPSNPHKTRKFDPQRTINLFVANVESGQGKAKHFLQSIPGLRQFSPPAFLTIAKTQENPTVELGGEQVYTVTVTCTGPDAADGALISEDFPSGFSFVSCTIAYSGGAAGPASATSGELIAGVAVTTFPAGGVATLTITGTLGSAGAAVNTSTASLGVSRVVANVSTVVTGPPAPVVMFTQGCRVFNDPPHAPPQEATPTLMWTVTGATSISISGIGAVSASGSSDAAFGTTYTLTAIGPGGTTPVDVTTNASVYKNGESYSGQPIYSGPTPDAVAVQVANWYCVILRGSTVVNYYWEAGVWSMRVNCADGAGSGQIGVQPYCP